MTVPSPLLELQQARGAVFSDYAIQEGQPGIPVVLAFGPIELEYAALRRTSVLVDQPQRGVIEVTGPDHIEFLNRMLTQELKRLAPGSVTRSFWLNRKGRIDADIRIWRLPDRTLLDVDVHAAGRTVDGLSAYIVADDVALREISTAVHRLALHGPSAAAVLAAVLGDAQGMAVTSLAAGACMTVTCGGEPVVVAREDSAGEIGLELMCTAAAARSLHEQLLDAGGWLKAQAAPAGSAEAVALRSAARIRPAGWHAFNIARIEAGTPLYYLDFGPDSLPAESGVFDDRVSLTKGCYLGQEIVARMHARGHPKQRLVAIACERQVPLPAPGDTAPPVPRQPETGSPVLDPQTPDAPIGAVTSAVTSPMLGQTPICFAMVKYERAAAGSKVQVLAEGSPINGVIQPKLQFHSKS